MVFCLKNGWGRGLWRKAVRQGMALVCGAIISNVMDPTMPLYSLSWFKHVLIASVTTFIICELTYAKNWLSNGDKNGGTPPKV